MIVLSDVSKKYGDVVVFDKLNLSFQKNKLTCIMGQSGSGKTTLIRMLMGLQMPDEGSITGLENLRISAVFQEDRLCEHLDVYANLLLPHLRKDSLEGMSKARMDYGLSAVGLLSFGEKKAGTLSGGMKRRTAILRALYAEYDILILDEPFKGLDDDIKAKTIDFVRNEAKGKTIIYITHDKAEAENIRPDAYVQL